METRTPMDAFLNEVAAAREAGRQLVWRPTATWTEEDNRNALTKAPWSLGEFARVHNIRRLDDLRPQHLSMYRKFVSQYRQQVTPLLVVSDALEVAFHTHRLPWDVQDVLLYDHVNNPLMHLLRPDGTKY